jgi:phosphohistidine phosphatase
MAAWLDRTLPLGTRIICSPALRCEQTVLALGRPYKLRKELSPDGQAEDVLQLAQWPLAKHAVLVVGHQPYLGQVVSLLMKMSPEQCSIKRGALWWLRSKSKGVEVLSTRIQCVQHPEML